MKHIALLILIMLNIVTASSVLDDFTIKFNINDSMHLKESKVIDGLSSNLTLYKSTHDTISTDMTKKTYRMKNWGISKKEAIQFIKGIQNYLLDNIDFLTLKKKSEIFSWNQEYEKFNNSGVLSITLPSFYTSKLYWYIKENYSLTDHGIQESQYTASLKELVEEYIALANEYIMIQNKENNADELNKKEKEIIKLKSKIESFRQHASQKGMYIYLDK